MIDFLPKKRRIPVEHLRLDEFPNTVTETTIMREVRRRIESGADPVEALTQVVEAIKNWARKEKPTASGKVQVAFDGGRRYTYHSPFEVAIGDTVVVWSSLLGSRQEAEVVELGSDYDGYLEHILEVRI